MEQRPHLVIDGALLAADAVGAGDIVLYVGADHSGADPRDAPCRQRPPCARARTAPPGERTGALCLRRGDRGSPLRQRRHRAAHVDSAASLRARCRRPADTRAERRNACARRADRPLRRRVVPVARRGRCARAPTLITVGGAVPQTMLIEARQGSTVADAVNAAGGLTSDSDAVLLGGYFGGWVESATAWGLPLDAERLRAQGYCARMRRGRGAARGTVRRCRDGADRRVPCPRERSPVRALHVRIARHLRDARASRGAHVDIR